MNTKIILLFIYSIDLYLFNSSMLLKIYLSFVYSMQYCNITSIQQLSQLKL